MSVASYDEDFSVDNSYSDGNSAVCSSHSPPHSPSSYYEHGSSSPPPAGPHFNFYGETKVLIIDTTRPPAFIIRQPDVDEADYDTVKSLDDENSKSNPDIPPDAVDDNDGATNVSMVNYVDETNFMHFSQPVEYKKFPTSWGQKFSAPHENKNISYPRSDPPVRSLPTPVKISAAAPHPPKLDEYMRISIWNGASIRIIKAKFHEMKATIVTIRRSNLNLILLKKSLKILKAKRFRLIKNSVPASTLPSGPAPDILPSSIVPIPAIKLPVEAQNSGAALNNPVIKVLAEDISPVKLLHDVPSKTNIFPVLDTIKFPANTNFIEEPPTDELNSDTDGTHVKFFSVDEQISTQISSKSLRPMNSILTPTEHT
eukprot:CAMPEP_0194345326 /NCGR_PEP_ID=MMETSP0171-20130528/104789_1 /TAXON_ID=218684 /ORGANISM="Corethron pennatum, Strain L29A3" /LENGTH=369 /DNA_ID=CAMNT_0039112293 /DNA_START=205 /DNA_END=1314 /DNA_ORIENTATION=+